ncbi:MAG: hypothetical protein R3335_06120 [Anaerolineales bacterium]|nr:hypothetical protein [Anaerolineales bacterium]
MAGRSLRVRKYLQRGRIVLANSLNSFLLFPLGILISTLIIRLTSPDLWGAVVGVMILAQLGAHVVAWGNQEYLLREFSRTPAGISKAWWQSQLIRLVLLPIPLAILLIAGYRGPILLWGLVWTAGLILRQAYQPLVVYFRDFTYSIVVELMTTALAVGAILLTSQELSLLPAVQILAFQSVLRGLFFTFRFLGRRIAGPGQTVSPLRLRYLWITTPFFLLALSGMLNSRIDLYLVNIFRPNEEVALYQILVTVIIFTQSAAAF